MRAHFIVIARPLSDDVSGVSKIAKEIFLEAFIPESAVERFAEPVLHGLAGRDVMP